MIVTLWIVKSPRQEIRRSQDQLFDATRALTEAEWQKVVCDEYLPKLIGKHALDGYSSYDPGVDPSIMNEFTTVASRSVTISRVGTRSPNEDGSTANPGGTGHRTAMAYLLQPLSDSMNRAWREQ